MAGQITSLAGAFLAATAATASPAQDANKEALNLLNTPARVAHHSPDSGGSNFSAIVQNEQKANAPELNWDVNKSPDTSPTPEVEKPVVLRASNDPLGAVAPLEVNKNDHLALHNILRNSENSGLNVEYNLRAGVHEFTIEYEGHEKTVSTRQEQLRAEVLLKGIQDVSTAAAMPNVDTEVASLNISQMSREQLINGIRELRHENKRLGDLAAMNEDLIDSLEGARNPDREFSKWATSASRDMDRFERTLSQPIGIQIERQLRDVERTISRQERSIDRDIRRLESGQTRIIRDWERHNLHIDPLQRASRGISDIVDRGPLNPSARNAKERVQEFIGRDFALDAAIVTEAGFSTAKKDGSVQVKTGVDALSALSHDQLARIMTTEAAAHFSLKNDLQMMGIELKDKGLSDSQLRQIDQLNNRREGLDAKARERMVENYLVNQSAVDRYIELAALSEGLGDAMKVLSAERRELAVVQRLSRDLIRNADKGIAGRAAEGASKEVRKGAENLGKEAGRRVRDVIEGVLPRR